MAVLVPYLMTKAVGAISLFVFLSGCATVAEQNYVPPVSRESAKRIFIVNYGWHTGLALKKADIPDRLLPEADDSPIGNSLEIGWGDRDFYRTPDAGVLLALKAVFFSSGSVLHVAAFSGPVEEYFRGAEILEVLVAEDGFDRLTRFVSDSFLRPETQKLQEAPPGLYPNSRFYPARGKFHLFRNCNTWVAEALQAAGLPVNPAIVITAGSLVSQVNRFKK